MNLLSIKEAADILSVKESTFRTWVTRKQIPDECIFRVGNTVRVRQKQFEDFVNGGI